MLLVFCCLCSLFSGCTGTNSEETTQATDAPVTGKEALQGKKIIFIGNSYTFWGQTVIHKGYSVLAQQARSYDPGYFYQICRENGIDVEVTNWTFGGHNITDFFGGPCQKEGADCMGEMHENYLTDRYFDYVAIQPYVEPRYVGNLAKHLEKVMTAFQEANPNVKFLLLIPQMAPERRYAWVNDLDDLEGLNITICNWGGMLHDISQGKTAVPGATQTYSRSSFVVSKDNHHENLLAGYITTLMVYCAITGESAVGQPYAFCDDSNRSPLFDFEAFKEKNYPNGGVSNFIEIFRSEADMKGLQQLVDQYLGR